MESNAYQILSMRTNDRKATGRLTNKISNTSKYDVGGILNAALGLSGEVGELNDILKKWIFHEKNLDVEHTKKEIGDIMWYVAMMCESFGWNLDDILQMNVDKLKQRYPDGFDVELANHRKDNDV